VQGNSDFPICVAARFTEAMFAAQLLDRQARIGFAQEANDLLLGVSLLHRSDLHLGLIGL
jgi:hypothetical protein